MPFFVAAALLRLRERVTILLDFLGSSTTRSPAEEEVCERTPSSSGDTHRELRGGEKLCKEKVKLKK